MHTLPTAPGGLTPDNGQVALLTRQLARERAARRQAEQLLEQKSLVLYNTNQELHALNTSLEQRVEARTRELALARDDALAASRAKSLFLANVSHELRTPLHAIINYAEMLRDDVTPFLPAASQQDLGTILSAANHLHQLIDRLLDYTKAEAGRMQVSIEPVEVAALVRQVIAIAQAQNNKHGNTLDLVMPALPGQMHTDPLRLTQCLHNLLSNATKFTEHGAITLTVERPATPAGEWLLFHVRDTGIGIAPEQLAKLFQPFTQADASISRRYGGTGLGLALTQQLATLLGGELSVSSQLGVGSCFTLSLPAHLQMEGHHDRDPA